MIDTTRKPLGGKAYGSIPHLPGSRRGPGDHGISEQQASLLLVKPRDRHDTVIVEEKLDGSCVSIANVGGELVPLTRAGYHALTSPYEQHHVFARWFAENPSRFRALGLPAGWRIVGEWLAQAHGTRYVGIDGWSVFAPFDIIDNDGRRVCREEFRTMLAATGMATPATVAVGVGMAVPLAAALDSAEIRQTRQAADGDLLEGVVYRIERKGRVDFLAKYVRPEKRDGCYLPEVSGGEIAWNWRP